MCRSIGDDRTVSVSILACKGGVDGVVMLCDMLGAGSKHGPREYGSSMGRPQASGFGMDETALQPSSSTDANCFVIVTACVLLER